MAEKKTTVVVDARPERKRGVASPAAKRMFARGRGKGCCGCGRGRGC